MYFTNEWSDWRNGVFFWLQTAYGADDKVVDSMLQTLDEFQKGDGDPSKWIILDDFPISNTGK